MICKRKVDILDLIDPECHNAPFPSDFRFISYCRSVISIALIVQREILYVSRG